MTEFTHSSGLGSAKADPERLEGLAGRVPGGCCEELKAAYERIKELEADLLQCREYLERHVDIVDGSYGEAAPNRAMQLCTMIDMSIYGPGGF